MTLILMIRQAPTTQRFLMMIKKYFGIFSIIGIFLILLISLELFLPGLNIKKNDRFKLNCERYNFIILNNTLENLLGFKKSKLYVYSKLNKSDINYLSKINSYQKIQLNHTKIDLATFEFLVKANCAKITMFACSIDQIHLNRLHELKTVEYYPGKSLEGAHSKRGRRSER